MTALPGSTRRTVTFAYESGRPEGGMAVARVGLTLGDAAGIGPEVLLQGLLHTDLHRRAHATVFVAAELEPWLRASCERFRLPVERTPLAGQPGLVLRAVPLGPPTGQGSETPLPRDPVPAAGVSTPHSRMQAFRALDALAQAAVAGELDVMVTGPVPKGIFDHLEPRPPGQTEFLAERLGARRFAMMLAGPRLRVVPVTTHVALRDVPKLLTTQRIVDCGLAAVDALSRWLDIAAPRLAVCGLNPHAGEGGRLGDEEARVIAPAIEELQRLGVQAEGPAVADTVFHRAMTGRYDAVLCMYHDQALGPLKTVHFHDATNLTCGLPVPRLSPDHGTAYDIAGRGLADPSSMVQTLTRAERMAAAMRRAEAVQ